ncbi:glycosyltransferase family 2 protein [Roseivivax sp. GX 12232]|uniref:glycosyltransferase family 2 protein n=1 Tax=Roseivivax sp. GX 12232 TaxID=2900547 RepID=UPI001E3112B3|nr:glycosyltransferase family A protein [Roseivivax sp. GX 12232]MCE0506451.1 glycosyltransferase family 2 protein [Roseivivax sp. GX 12232]
MPRISVIIPCLNAAATLEATLDSIACQSFTDWEVLVIDDGSTDATCEILARRAAADRRILWTANPGRGPSAARNHGALALARGEIIAFCDADDIWAPGKLDAVNRAMNYPRLDAVFGQIAFFQATPEDARSVSTVPVGRVTIPMLLGENPVGTLSNLSIRRAAFAMAGGFDAGMVHNEDLDFLVRLVGEGCELRGLDGLHLYYRASPAGLSSDLRRMQAARARVIETARRYGHRPAARAEAVYLRYLARRALRLDLGGAAALGLALQGLARHPRGFLSPVRRGLATTLAAAAAPFMPRRLRRALFTN